MAITLRFAAPEDAAKLVEIYRPYVEGTTVTFEYDVPSVEEFRERIVEYSSEFPYIVCEADGVAVGYAYAHKYAARFSYRFSTELSIYLDKSYRGMGIGRRLYGALIELLGEMGYKNLYGRVTSPNPASSALHKAFGFKEIGCEHGVGYKFGRWIDIVTYELIVGEKHETEDKSRWRVCPMRIGEIDGTAILKKHSEQ